MAPAHGPDDFESPGTPNVDSDSHFGTSVDLNRGWSQLWGERCVRDALERLISKEMTNLRCQHFLGNMNHVLSDDDFVGSFTSNKIHEAYFAILREYPLQLGHAILRSFDDMDNMWLLEIRRRATSFEQTSGSSSNSLPAIGLIVTHNDNGTMSGIAVRINACDNNTGSEATMSHVEYITRLREKAANLTKAILRDKEREVICRTFEEYAEVIEEGNATWRHDLDRGEGGGRDNDNKRLLADENERDIRLLRQGYNRAKMYVSNTTFVEEMKRICGGLANG